MRTKKRHLVIAPIIILIAVCIAHCEDLPSLHEREATAFLKNEGNKVVKELDKYYRVNGKYPNENDWEIIKDVYKKSGLKDTSRYSLYCPRYLNAGNEYVLKYPYVEGLELFYYSKTKIWYHGILKNVLKSFENIRDNETESDP
jgi:hypothetical protein